MSNQASGTQADHSTTIDEFRKPPLGAVIFFALLALVGLALLVRGLITQAVATCHGATMSLGETCTSGSRRSSDYTQDFQTRLDIAEGALRGQQFAGVLVLLAALAAIGLLLGAWRRDVRMLEGLTQERPEHSHTDRGLLVPIFGALSAIVMLGAGGYLFFSMQAASGFSPLWSILLGALIVAGLVVLVMSRPKGATALLAYPSALGVVSRGERATVPYSDVQYFVSDTIRSFNWVGSGRSNIMLSKDESPEFRDAVAQRAHTAWFTAAPERLTRGEALDFGDITLRRDALTIDGRTIGLSDVSAFRAVKESDATFYEALDGSGAVLARTDTSQVSHTAVLRQLLSQSGISLP